MLCFCFKEDPPFPRCKTIQKSRVQQQNDSGDGGREQERSYTLSFHSKPLTLLWAWISSKHKGRYHNTASFAAETALPRNRGELESQIKPHKKK
jgi:hypothetical protein